METTTSHCYVYGRLRLCRDIGKHCRCCGVPVLCCEACLSSTTANITTRPLRCPLCMEQNTTVAAHDVVYTNKGVTAAEAIPLKPGTTSREPAAKAAPSVCK